MSIRSKLGDFISSHQSVSPVLVQAASHIKALLELSEEERQSKFEENNFTTTDWLESVVELVRY